MHASMITPYFNKWFCTEMHAHLGVPAMLVHVMAEGTAEGVGSLERSMQMATTLHKLRVRLCQGNGMLIGQDWKR
jgi:hypothetical protein